MFSCACQIGSIVVLGSFVEEEAIIGLAFFEFLDVPDVVCFEGFVGLAMYIFQLTRKFLSFCFVFEDKSILFLEFEKDGLTVHDLGIVKEVDLGFDLFGEGGGEGLI